MNPLTDEELKAANKIASHIYKSFLGDLEKVVDERLKGDWSDRDAEVVWYGLYLGTIRCGVAVSETMRDNGVSEQFLVQVGSDEANSQRAAMDKAIEMLSKKPKKLDGTP